MTSFDGTLATTAPDAASAAASAAAASFAGLLGKLDYLNPADIECIRQAYRFADEGGIL